MELLSRRCAYALVVHTNDSSPCARCFLNEPIIVFGEMDTERRNWLTELMAKHKLDEEGQLENPMKV